MKTAKLFNGLPLWGKLVLIGVVILLVYIFYRKLLIYLQGLKKQTLTNTVVTSGTGTNTITIDLGAKALEIYNAFYNYWGGMAEDEDTAISVLKTIPSSEMTKFSNLYFSLYAKNLKEDFIKYTDFNEISYKFTY